MFKIKMKYFGLVMISGIIAFGMGERRVAGQTSHSDYTPYEELPGIIKSYKPVYSNSLPDWAKMLYQFPVNFNEISNRFRNYMRLHKGEENAMIRYYKIWSRVMESYALSDGTIKMPDVKAVYKEMRETQLNAYNRGKSVTDNGSSWTFLGPKQTFYLNSSNNPTPPGSCPWQANVYSFDVASSNDSILYCGTETGFVNKSTDKGNTWHLLGQNYPYGGAVTAVAINPKDANMVYVAAGGQIHKSTDGGVTWVPMLSSGSLFYADRIKIDSGNVQKIIAASNLGVQVSSDGGITWQVKWSERAYDVEFKPGDSNTIFAITVSSSGKYHIVVSLDGGSSFSTISSFPDYDNESGGLLAMTAANPNILYVALLSKEGGESVPYILKGTYNTDTWTWVQTKKGEYGSVGGLGGFTNGQGYFDFVLEASPADENLLLFGTCSLWRSADGGTTFNAVGGYQGNFPLHPDIQDIKLLPDGTAWVSTDGGLTYSTDNFYLNFRSYPKINGVVGSDFWGFDQGWNEDIVVGGRYHNGNSALGDFFEPKGVRMGGAESPTGWVIQGKSRHVAFSDLGNGWILPKTAESAPEGRFVFSKYPNMDEYGGRRGNMVFHPNYYNLVYLGNGNGFWVSKDMGVSFDLLYNFPGEVRYLQISYHNPNVLYADIVGKGLYKTTNGGENWVQKPTLTSGSYGSSYWNGKLFFVISPYNENRIYACLSNGAWSVDEGKVFRSSDGGNTWENWTGTVLGYYKSMAIQPTKAGTDLVYLFTTSKNGKAAKVYYRGGSMTDWDDFSSNYPAGFGLNMALPFYRDSKIRAGGSAGVWESPLAEPDFTPIINPWVQQPVIPCKLDTLCFDDHSMLDHSGVSWHWSITPAPAYISDPNIRNPKVVVSAQGYYSVTLEVTKGGQTYSRTINSMVYVNACPSLDNCDNPAEIPKNNWSLLYVDSEENAYGRYGENAFDGDPNTFWHTKWYNVEPDPPHPHEIQVDMADTFNIHKFTYLPRQDGQNGRVLDYELYFTENVSDWGNAVTTGQFENSTAPQTIVFSAPVEARYFKFKALSEVNDNPWTSVGEITMTGCYYVQEPNGIHKPGNISGLIAFPVPANNIVNISLPGLGKYSYCLYSITGKIVDQGTIENGGLNWDYNLNNCQPGTYLMQLVDESKVVYRVKLVRVK